MLILIPLAVLISILVLTRFASTFGLLADPGDHRQHHRPTPLVGGLAIFVGLSFACFLYDRSLLTLFPSFALLSLSGALDDRFKLTSGLRLLIQAIAAVFMIHYAGAELVSLGDLFTGQEVLLGRWSTALTVFATIGVINAVNMSDGMDGLAGSLVCLILTCLWCVGGQPQSLIIATTLSILVFLCFNLRIKREQASVFMGDAGSTLLGFILAYLMIVNSQGASAVIPPVAALWVVALPLVDTVAVLLVRPLRGQSPFSADRIHYHHLIQLAGFSVNQSLLVILGLQGLLAIGALYAVQLGVNEHFMFYAFCILFCVYFAMLFHHTRSSRSKQP